MAKGKTAIFTHIYSWALIFFVLSLPLSKYTISLASFLLLALWIWSDLQLIVVARFFRQKGLLQGFYFLILYLIRIGRNGIGDRTRIFLHNKAALIFASIYIIDVAGLLETTDFSYGLKDLKIKLPLLLFPLIFSSLEKIDFRLFKKILLFYIAAIFTGTMIGAYILLKGDYVNIRDISPFISSIHFGLNLSFGFFILMYFIASDVSFTIRQKIFMGTLALWFLVFLYFMESLTSLGAILFVGLAYLIYLTFKLKRSFYIKTAFVLLILAIPSSFYFYLKKEVKTLTTAPVLNPGKLDKFTALGNPYTFDTLKWGIEDGKYVGLYLSIPELKQAWAKRSKIPYNGLDKKGNPLSKTLIRYLTSRNLRKDAAGVAALSTKDIKLIENGVANYNYIAHPGIHARLLKIIKGYEVYQKTGNPSGNSVFQRLEYLKAALKIVKTHFWTGVGTGSLQQAFYHEFKSMHSKLLKKFMFHSNNQFLDIFVAFGVFGFLFFIFTLIYPVILTKSYKNYFFVTFYLIMIISMFSDDTLETHAGVSLFAFFSSFIMFGIERKNASKAKDKIT